MPEMNNKQPIWILALTPLTPGRPCSQGDPLTGAADHFLTRVDQSGHATQVSWPNMVTNR
jgi:hypothetical protein